jgi:molybdenum-dependent DNA-binding transcriptional regulator ModE
MIPEQYWQILRRWFWIIISLGVAGGAAGMFVLPMGLSGSSQYDASMSLGVSRFVYFGGTMTAGTGTGDAVVLGDYTASIADKAKTVQFQARLRAALEQQGLFVAEAALPQKVTITADKALFRINIRATASSAKDAEMLAQEAADVLTKQVVDEETRVKEGLGATTDEQRAELLSRLSDLQQQLRQKLQSLDAATLRTALDDLVTRGGVDPGTSLSDEFRFILESLAIISGDQDLADINSHTDALEKKLAALALAEESFSVDLVESGEPVFVVDPVETVATEASGTLRKRDMLVLGTGAGLIVGWVAANMVDNAWNGRGSRREEEEGEA